MSMISNQISSLAEDIVDQALQADLVKTYRTTFSMKEIDLPMTQVGFDLFFGPKINMFAGDTSRRPEGISSNTTLTNAVDIPFLIRCIAVYVAVEPVGFTSAGASIATPDASSSVPAFDGVLLITAGSGVPVPSTVAPQYAIQKLATFEWGQGTWKAAHAFMQAYRMQMLLGGRLELFNELCADVGNLDSHSPWEGYSNSLAALPAYVAHVNAREREIERGKTFLPATAQVVNLPGQTAPTVIGVPAPLVPASWGGPVQEGLFCGCYPVRGILLVPGMPINLNFVRDNGDSIYFAALNDALVEKNDVKYDVNFTDNVQTAPGTTVANATTDEFKGGKLRLGIVMRGFELTPRAAIQWYGTYGGSFGQLYAVQAAATSLAEYALLAGVPGGLGGLPEWMAAEEAKANAGLAEPCCATGWLGGMSVESACSRL